MPKKLRELDKRGYLLPETINPAGRVYICVPVPDDPNHIRAFLGQLDMLSHWNAWDRDTLKKGTLAAQVWRDIVTQVRQNIDDGASCAPELPETSGCVDYPLSSSFISWYPLSPYTHAGEVPDGWELAPFTVLDAAVPFTELTVGDVMATGFPQPTSGDLTLPAIGLDVQGTGTIELHFLNTVNGGMVLITVDGDLLTTSTLDLNADILAEPPETVGEELIFEIDIEEEGSHHIDIRFSPVFDDSLTPIRFGGGIRSVVLCGFDEMSLDIRTDPDNDCLLQKTYDGTAWENVIDVSACAESVVTNNVTNLKGKVWRVSGGVTQYSEDGDTYINYTDDMADAFGMPDPYPDGVPVGVDAACIAAKNATSYILTTFSELSKQVSVGASVLSLVAGIMALIAAIFTAGLTVPLAVTAFAGSAVNAGNNFFSSLFTSEVTKQLECDLYDTFDSEGTITSSQFSELISLWQSRSTIVWTMLAQFLNVMGPIGLTKIGLAETGGITDCDVAPCDDTIIRTYDFLVSPNPFSPALRSHQEQVETITQGDKFADGNALWVAGRGYKDKHQLSLIGTSNRNWPHSRIHMYFPHAATINFISVEVELLKSALLPTTARVMNCVVWNTAGTQIFIQQFNIASAYANGITTIVNSTSLGWNVPAGAEFKLTGAYFSQDNTGVAPPYDGYIYIRKLTLTGTE